MTLISDRSLLAKDRESRPMLARDADSMYWLARYVERAEHVARLLLVNSNLLMEVADLAPALQQRQWQSLLTILRLPELPRNDQPMDHQIRHYMTLDLENPSSLISCLSRARENARGIREAISAEMWEAINSLYWYIRGDDIAARLDESPEEPLRHIMTGSMLFQGLTDQTLGHGQRWRFTQLGKYFERIDVTARLIDTKFEIFRSAETVLETPLRNIHWMAVLRSCCSIEAYRRQHLGDLDPLRVASFLILEREYPRSIRYCVRSAHDAVAGIRAAVAPTSTDPTERILGRLEAELEYAETAEIVLQGLPAYLQRIQDQITLAATALQKQYFLR